MNNDQLEKEAGEFFDESLPEGEPENYEHDQEGGTPEGKQVGKNQDYDHSTSIMEKMDDIVSRVEELKKLMNYKEDAEDTFTSEKDAETKDPDSLKY